MRERLFTQTDIDRIVKARRARDSDRIADLQDALDDAHDTINSLRRAVDALTKGNAKK